MSASKNTRHQNKKSQAYELLGNGHASEARALLARLCKSQAADAELLFALGVAEGMLGNFTAAENSLKRAAASMPGQASVHYSLGKALKAQDKLDQAVDSFSTACRLEPENAAIHNDLGNALAMLGRHLDALSHLQQATSLSPGTPSYHYNQGNILTYLGLNEQAVSAYRQAIALQPDFRTARIALGDALLGLGQLDDALSVYGPILQENPADPGALIGTAAVMDKRGEFAEARKLLAPIFEAGQVDAFTAATFAGFSHHIDCEDEAARLAEQALENPGLTAAERARLYFSLGRIHDRNKQFDKAFHYYAEGNTLRRSDFDREAHRDYIDQLMATFSPAFMSQAARARNTSELPVFIVGMPRSGTSLIEQILASHPRVHGAGELELLPGMTNSIMEGTGNTRSFSQAVHALTADLTSELAETYLGQLKTHDRAACRITDKMPVNFMFLGIIDLLFPSARIIHCKRNPLDTCLSCFFQDFAGNHPYSNDLASLGEYFLEYERIMAHWRPLLRVPVFEVQYEDLVANAESVVPDLVRFCGLEWDDACLNFHKSRRAIATASYDQVRQPLYTSSLERWRHYEKHMGELSNVLGLKLEEF